MDNRKIIYLDDAIDAVEESRRLNHHQDGKAASCHEYEHRHFIKILSELPSAEPDWIPCNEKLPEDSYDVLFCTDQKEMFIGCCYQYLNGEYDIDDYEGGIWEGNVIAWMPLPEPYRRGDKNDFMG